MFWAQRFCIATPPNRTTAIFTVLHLGQVLTKYTDNPDSINQGLDEGIRLIANPTEPGENGERNQDLLKVALELCEKVWRLVSVEEFVMKAKKLKEKNR